MVIVAKRPIDERDSPPPYNEVVAPSSYRSRNGDSKGDVSPILQQSPSAGPSNLPSPTYRANLGASHQAWFSWFTEKDSRKQVKQTIQSLITDVVKEATTPAAAAVLQSCADACQARGLSFQSIMCEKFIEGHSPFYWAIVKRSSVTNQDGNVYQDVDLLDILLSIPLDSSARAEAYLACLVISDHNLFCRLRKEETSKGSPHEILLGTMPDDSIDIFDGNPDYGAFRVSWRIASFQQRMRVIGSISAQVVARGRLWSFCFMILSSEIWASNKKTIKAGTWVALISLLSPSPSSSIYAQLSIVDPMVPHLEADNSTGAPPASGQSNMLSWMGGNSRNSPKPPITLKFETHSKPLEPIPLWSPDADIRRYIQSQSNKCLILPLDSHWNGHSLQFDGCSYLDSDGYLNVVLDGSLTKPSSDLDCVIS